MNDTPSAKEREDHTPYELEQARLCLAYTGQVVNKMHHGIYTTEDVPCFCGADKSQDFELITKDRYGIPLRMVICKECALIRANPRLTAESFKSFYNDEYRHIFLVYSEQGRIPIKNDEEHEHARYLLQENKGKALVDICYREMVDLPETVIDFGCHFGGQLAVLKEQGVKNLYGVDIDKSARKGAKERTGIDCYATLDELIAKGVKANLIIMQDIIEHLTDLRETLDKISQLLAKDGILYVWTPGLFSGASSSAAANLFQIAHTYQFCSMTLDYVMSQMGWEPVYYDENIVSLWKFGRDPQAITPGKPQDWYQFQIDQLLDKEDRLSPRFRGTCKFSKRERFDNIVENYKKGIPDLWAITQKSKGAVAIVSGGPSVDDELGALKKMKADGVPIMCIARMYPWCIDNGLGPNYVVAMDSTADQIKGFDRINPDTTHLMCSVVHPSLGEKLSKEKTYIWDNQDEPKIRDMRQKSGYLTASVIGAGGTVTVSCLSLAINLGFDDIHIFGADCMYKSLDHVHARGISGPSAKMYPEQVTIEGKQYFTSPTMLIFVHNMLDMVWAAHEQGVLKNIKFHGDSLINVMWDGKFLTEKEVEEITGRSEEEKPVPRVLGRTACDK